MLRELKNRVVFELKNGAIAFGEKINPVYRLGNESKRFLEKIPIGNTLGNYARTGVSWDTIQKDLFDRVQTDSSETPNFVEEQQQNAIINQYVMGLKDIADERKLLDQLYAVPPHTTMSSYSVI